MQNLTLRLIYPPSVPTPQLKAARSGLESFSRFGINVESAIASEKAFIDVRCPVPLRNVAYADKDIRIDSFPGISDDQRTVFGIAITPHSIIIRDGGKDRILVAMGGYLKSGAISLRCSKELPERMRQKGITAAVKYEAGHLLIPSPDGLAPNCDNGCLMRRPTSFLQFVHDIVSNNLDFCKDCCHAIEETIRQRRINLN
jgi:hypothetical protein